MYFDQKADKIRGNFSGKWAYTKRKWNELINIHTQRANI